MKVYINGEYHDENDAKISVFDHGFLYGDGVFEGIRTYEGCVFKLDEHLERLEHSANAIYLTLPIPLSEIKTAVLNTLRLNELKNAYIRLILTRGAGGLGIDMRKCQNPANLVIITGRIEIYPPELYAKGLQVKTSIIRQKAPDQLTPNIKSLNYLANILAHAEAVRAGSQEAILLTREGYVSECSADNIFYVYGGEVFTPPASAGILEGITRGSVIHILREQCRIATCEKPVTLYDLYRADEVFLTGTGAEVIGVVNIDGHSIGGGVPGPMTKQLTEMFREYARVTGSRI